MEITASLRIVGNDLEPDEISQQLGLRPDQSHRRGDSRVGKSGARYAPYSNGLWSFRSRAKPTDDLETHLMSLCDELQPLADVLDDLRTRGLELDVFAGVFGLDGNAVLRIGAATLSRLGQLGLELALDVYE
jgi:hypothetical protein